MSEIPLYAFIVISNGSPFYEAETLDEGLPAAIKGKAIAVSKFTMNPPGKNGFSYKNEKNEKKSKFKEFRKEFYAKGTEQQESELAEYNLKRSKEKSQNDEKSKATLQSGETNHQNELWDMLIANTKEIKNIEGTLSFTKDVDAITPILHRLCVNYNQKNEKVEPLKEIAAYFFHLENGKTELTSAYILQNCKITKVNVSSDDDDLPSETIEASFQKMFIYLKVLLPLSESKDPNNRWGWRRTRWDFFKGEEPKDNPVNALEMMGDIK